MNTTKTPATEKQFNYYFNNLSTFIKRFFTFKKETTPKVRVLSSSHCNLECSYNKQDLWQANCLLFNKELEVDPMFMPLRCTSCKEQNL